MGNNSIENISGKLDKAQKINIMGKKHIENISGKLDKAQKINIMGKKHIENITPYAPKGLAFGGSLW